MLNFEVGYTPTNLRLAIASLSVTQAALARLLGVSDRTLRQWLVEDLEAIGHRDMPLKQWRKVLALLDGKCRLTRTLVILLRLWFMF